MLKHGTVIRKWSHNDLPSEEQLSKPLEQSELGKMPKDSAAGKIATIVLWFALPLALLTLADRLIAWTAWIKKKEKSNKILSTFKKKRKMRKKIVAGNWKMNMNLQDGVALAKEIN